MRRFQGQKEKKAAADQVIPSGERTTDQKQGVSSSNSSLSMGAHGGKRSIPLLTKGLRLEKNLTERNSLSWGRIQKKAVKNLRITTNSCDNAKGPIGNLLKGQKGGKTQISSHKSDPPRPRRENLVPFGEEGIFPSHLPTR